jgi:hypothetical protein
VGGGVQSLIAGAFVPILLAMTPLFQARDSGRAWYAARMLRGVDYF